MDWSGIFINWEAPLFWSVIGALVGLGGGYFVARHFYKKTGIDLERIRDEIFDKIDQSNLSPELKAHLKADADARLKGVFYTFPWEAEYAKEIIGEADTNIVVTQVKSPRKKGSEGEGGSSIEF
jgi:hypothetical protein